MRCAAGNTPISAARRFSAVALWCFVAMALSGVLNTVVRIRPAEVFHTSYGYLVLAKVAALLVLAMLGWRQRRSVVAAPGPTRMRGPADPVGVGRGSRVRPDLRRSRRTRPHAATAEGDSNPRPPRSPWDTTSPAW